MLFGLFLLVYATTFSQTHYGIKAGLNVSNVNFNLKNASPDANFGLHAGTFIEHQIYQRLHLQTELIFSREGIQEASIDYLNFPVILKLYFVEGIHINAGPQLGILLNAKGGTNGLRSTNFATVFGVGYEATRGFMIDARYALGISNILSEDFYVDSGMGYNISGIQGLSRAFQLSLGYKF
jgi:hypothetical protein